MGLGIIFDQPGTEPVLFLPSELGDMNPYHSDKQRPTSPLSSCGPCPSAPQTATSTRNGLRCMTPGTRAPGPKASSRSRCRRGRAVVCPSAATPCAQGAAQTRRSESGTRRGWVGWARPPGGKGPAIPAAQRPGCSCRAGGRRRGRGHGCAGTAARAGVPRGEPSGAAPCKTGASSRTPTCGCRSWASR